MSGLNFFGDLFGDGFLFGCGGEDGGTIFYVMKIGEEKRSSEDKTGE